MKKYEKYSKEQLQEFCNKSISYRELCQYVGYSCNGGSSIDTIKEMIEIYNLDISHFQGKSHRKNKGKFKTPTTDYLNNNVCITSYKLRNRLLADNYFERKCCCCGNTDWLGNPIPLELHHKDGNKENNNLDNLELRCPNCHYFTDTYKTKNRK